MRKAKARNREELERVSEVKKLWKGVVTQLKAANKELTQEIERLNDENEQLRAGGIAGGGPSPLGMSLVFTEWPLSLRVRGDSADSTFVTHPEFSALSKTKMCR